MNILVFTLDKYGCSMKRQVHAHESSQGCNIAKEVGSSSTEATESELIKGFIDCKDNSNVIILDMLSTIVLHTIPKYEVMG